MSRRTQCKTQASDRSVVRLDRHLVVLCVPGPVCSVRIRSIGLSADAALADYDADGRARWAETSK